ncbi:MAG: L-glutamate gamma-semialdehyde dehydrogenase, partial [Candidatus Wallbacteria bacterium]|nr:L-glutamate gamma-semialdehyde dehydrogenase [Candidatus Wallbacteria bacterium]
CCIGGEWIKAEQKIKSVNPSHTDQVVGVVQNGDIQMGDRAVASALRTFETWSRTPAHERAAYFFKAKKLLQERKYEFNAWLVYEVGKTWAEADGDVAETIDFLDYYARSMLRLANPPALHQVPGEENKLYYIPLGVGVAIPPWNFPCAIMAGLVVSAAVAGNTVVLKPSSDSPVIATKFVQLLEEAGLPKGVVNLVTGPGSSLGDHLVKHPKVRFISFTGSMEVGIHMNAEAAKVGDGQVWLKRLIAEMGGKNAIIVAEDADIDAAVGGVVASAFGYQGQKCSACSRAIVVKSVHETFVNKLVAATRALKVGPTEDPATNVGPVASASAYRDILGYIEVGMKEGKLLCGGEKAAGDGWYIAPTIFDGIKPDARIAQEEIFGPVLAVLEARDYDHALELANGTRYGLTGSVFSRDEKKLEKAAREFHTGNLYLNRKCTGAMVGRHPFGGFNMSGTDSKTGGPDYLLQFTQAKTVCWKR